MFESETEDQVLVEVPDVIRNIADKLNSLWTPETIKLTSGYQPKDSDIIITGPAKSGTTWMQHIVHGLRSKGNMNFEDMSLTVPVIEYIFRGGNHDLYAPQEFQPNCFKTHIPYDVVPKGNAKHIILVRNPADTAVSGFYWFQDWFYKKEELSLPEYVDWFYIKPCPPHNIPMNSHTINSIVKTYPHRRDEGVLWMHYEDLKADLQTCIKMISDFTGLGVGDQELLNLVGYQSSFEFMRKHKDKFDAAHVKKVTKEYLGYAQDEEILGAKQKLRKGEVNQAKKDISPEQLEQIEARWRDVVTPICGYKSYQEMRDGINKELGRSFASM